jgi:L-cysteine S-thiosulfotransferase
MRVCAAASLLVIAAMPLSAIMAASLVDYKIVVAKGVPTIREPLAAEPGNAKRGEEVMIGRQLGNCLSCHEVTALRGYEFHGEVGPSLDGTGRRWDAAALRMIMVDPKRVFGDATAMPAFYRIDGLNRVRPEFEGKPILSAQQVEDVVAYLAVLK